MRKKKNKGLKIFIIILASLIFVGGIVTAIVLLTKNTSLNYLNVKLNGVNGQLTLAANSNSLAPNKDITNRPILINITKESENVYLRAKVIFENDSEDDRVLSFVSQLNYYINEIDTFKNDLYSWQYFQEDNSFYLMSKDTENLRLITKLDDNYIFVERLKVPASISQIDSLNSEGNNVQVGEDITVKVIFEAVQSAIPITGSAKIENVREFFNQTSVYKENNFISENGYITNYSGNSENVILPKYVGKDYIIGVKEDAFKNSTLKKLIIPGNYIFFENNAFYNLTNLEFVALKNFTKMYLSPTTFSAKANLDIYAPVSTSNFVKTNYSTYSYNSNFKEFTNVVGNDISSLDTNTSYIYAPTATEIQGDFKNFTNLKAIFAPNLTTINNNMFESLSSLILADFPNVENIGSYAFNNCSNILNVNFSKSLQQIGEYSFANCSKLNNISFIKNLTIIPRQAFRNCNAITKIQLNSTDVEILSAAFYSMKNLVEVKINSLKTLADYSFGECDNLSYFSVISANNLIIDNKAFSNSTNHSNASNIVFAFNSRAVRDNFTTLTSNLKYISFTVNNNVLTRFEGNIKNLNLSLFANFFNFDKIGQRAFSGANSLTNLTLNSEITQIGDYFIENLDNLIQIEINNYIPPVFSENAFTNARENLTILVPERCLNLYMQTLKDFNVNVVSYE